MTTLQKIRARLIATSTCLSRSVLLRHSGISPELSWDPGETIPNQRRPKNNAGWQITSQLDVGDDLSAHIESIIERVGRSLVHPECDIRMYCFVYHFHRPDLYISIDALRGMSELGASLDIDVFKVASQARLEELRI